MSTNQQARGRGRPRLNPDEPLSSYVRLRFTATERELIDAAAGGNLSVWLRAVAVRAAKRARKVKP